jgi:serine phosphatase RsbU (regulator of sigma subunit)
VEEKQKEILDSIQYAKKIQKTLLAHDSLLDSELKDYFVLYRPKDIVSGDFYWATNKDNRFYLAVCDSTGHGVPGAFMSLLNASLLNEAITEKNIKTPGEVFNYVREKLIGNLSSEAQKDGMDGVLICMNRNDNSVTYAAANNKPVLISGTDLTELPNDKMPIGIGEKAQDFNTYTIDYATGDCLYLFTDGYADQFGGEKGKKFKYRQLEALLQGINAKTSTEKKDILNHTFEKWKGNLEQVDDVTIVGIKIRL